MTKCDVQRSGCKKTNWFNACSECVSGYAYKDAGNKLLDFEECFEHSDPNCFLFNQQGS